MGVAKNAAIVGTVLVVGIGLWAYLAWAKDKPAGGITEPPIWH